MPSNENETYVRSLVESWAAAVRNRDINAILAHHADDMVMFDVPPPFQSIGLEAYRKTWDLFYGWQPDGPVVFDILEMKVIAGDDVAFCYATMGCETPTNSGGKEALRFRLTTGLEKRDDQWLIVHEHHSVPSAD